MSHTVEVPEKLFREVAARAQRTGQAPEELLLALVEDGMRREADASTPISPEDAPINDPIAPFIGAFEFGRGDVAERHDYYLSRSHKNDHADAE